MPFDTAPVHLFPLGAAALFLIAAAASDSWRYRIPNWTCLGLLALFPAFVLTAPYAVAWQEHLVVFGLALAVGFILYARHVTGAGDIKLLAVMSLWAGPPYLGMFLFITAISGGLLALVIAAINYRRNQTCPPDKVVALARVPIPYGVAIAIGGLCALIMLSHPPFVTS